MIQRFSVENYGPFKDTVTVSFDPSSLKDSDAFIFEDIRGHKVLTAVGLFGMNASGKSYILQALTNLVYMMSHPLPAATPMFAYAPFRLSNSTKNAPVRMHLDFTCSEESFSYDIEYDSVSILRESLDHYPKGQRAGVFKRDGSSVTTPTGKFADIHSISRFVGANSTVLSVCAQFNLPMFVDVVRYLGLVQMVNPDLQNALENVIRMANEDPSMKKMILDALSAADFGIEDMSGKISQADVLELRNAVPPQILGMMIATGTGRVNQTSLHLVHHSSDGSLSTDDRSFDFMIESSGTLRMIAIIGPVLQALRSGGMLLIDEFGAYLDHDICEWIIGLFRTATNSNGAQLLFNSHNQMLIDTDGLFRRDQVYLSDKDTDTGEATVYPLSECSIRKDANVLKMYRVGKLGGRPYIVDPGIFDFHEQDAVKDP